ncbi:interferon-related developmental regulator family protein / IFRD protein family [Tasmannia lanceolata]|uniref:interferon-related developmental regulator family protein / IFRD protein family n=1 Tax=Tasmannia lanceolata TaxID=3420 RepID=UPI004062C407
MGKRNSQRKNAATFDSDDDTLSSCSTSMSDVTQVQETEEVNDEGSSLDKYLDALYEKRGSTRENALSGLVDAFLDHLQIQFAENNCITLQHQLINSVKRGSIVEASLASHALGLVAITIGCGDNAHEIVEESTPHLALALKSGSEPRKRSSVLDCLAIITFVGGNDCEETQKVMQIMWQLIHPKSGSNVAVASKPTSAVLAVAVSAWSFLLTTIDGSKINSNNWQEYISYLSILLDKEDRSIRIAAGEAIALIFEIGSLEKFDGEVKNCIDGSTTEGNNSRGGFAHVEALKGKILSQVRNLCSEAGGKGLAKKDLNTQRNLFREVLTFIETGYFPETSIKIQNVGELKISTWTQSIQLNFLKRVLGRGFQKHMQENELLHDVFGFTPKKKNPFGTEVRLNSNEKRIFRSPNSAVSKARTQSLNKQRMLAQGRNNGHYASVVTNEED